MPVQYSMYICITTYIGDKYRLAIMQIVCFRMCTGGVEIDHQNRECGCQGRIEKGGSFGEVMTAELEAKVKEMSNSRATKNVSIW